MRAQGLNRANNDSAVPTRLACCCCSLLAGLMMLGAQLGHAQASQSASQPAAQQQNAPAPANEPADAPMVMGENPDSQDTASTPGQPSASPAPPAGNPGQQQANPAAGTLVPWSPAEPLPGASAPSKSAPAHSAPAHTAAAPAPTFEAIELAAQPLPVPPPADAGGNSARQSINNQCVDLLKMANELKAEVAKTNKDVLSISVVRDADKIERLAHHVRDEMKPEVGKN